MNYKSILTKIVKNKWKNSEIKSLKKMFRSFKYPVFDVLIENPKKEIIIKLIEHKEYEKRGYTEKNVTKLILNKFPDFPIHKIIKFDDSKHLISCPYIIEEKIPGKDLTDINLSKIKNKKEFIISFAKFAGQMNSIPFEKSGYFDEKLKIKPMPWFDLIMKEVSGYVDRIEKNNFLDKSTLIKVKQYIESKKHLMKIKNKPRFVHSDYHGSNIKAKIVNNQCRITGIFDFESCLSGDPVRELYKAEWILDKLPNYKKYFYEEYSKYVKLPKDYKERLEFYQLFGRLKHIQFRKKFEKSSVGRTAIKQGIKVIKSIVK